MFRVTASNQSAFAKKYSDQMSFNEVYTRGGYGCHRCWGRRWKRNQPLMWQKTARYINFSPCLLLSPTRRNPGLHSMYRLFCCSELANLNKLFQIWKKKKKRSVGVHFVRNYIFAGKVNFEGSLNDCRGIEGEWKREREGGEKKNRKGGGDGIVMPRRGALGVMEKKGAREQCREGGSY